jgi:hypothetical protein
MWKLQSYPQAKPKRIEMMERNSHQEEREEISANFLWLKRRSLTYATLGAD